MRGHYVKSAVLTTCVDKLVLTLRCYLCVLGGKTVRYKSGLRCGSLLIPTEYGALLALHSVEIMVLVSFFNI